MADWIELDEGRIRLALGDCLSILPELEPGSVDAVVTDPQYGLGDLWTGGTWFTQNVYAGDKVEWDTEASDVSPILELNLPSIIWGGNYFALPPSRCWLSWAKRDGMPTMSDMELAWTNLDRPSKEFYHRRNGWNRVHPTEKPVELMAWCLKFLEGETILDPFMGSGTTGVACIRLGRKFIGIEREEKYFDIALRRLKAELSQPRLFPATPSPERQAELFREEGAA